MTSRPRVTVLVLATCAVLGAAPAFANCERYTNLSDGTVLTLGRNAAGEAPATLRKFADGQVAWTSNGALICGRGDEPCELRLPTIKATPDPEGENNVQVPVEIFEDDGREYLVAVGLSEYLMRVFDEENEEQLAVEPPQRPYGEGDPFLGSVFRCARGS